MAWSFTRRGKCVASTGWLLAVLLLIGLLAATSVAAASLPVFHLDFTQWADVSGSDLTIQVGTDMNQNGVVNGLDVDPFVVAVVGGGTQSAPEPSALVLVGIAALLFGIRRRLG